MDAKKHLLLFGGGNWWDTLNDGTIFGGGLPLASWNDANSAVGGVNLPSVRTIMNISGEYAIRQTGTIKRIDFRWRAHLSTAGTQRIKFKILRPLGSNTYRLIDETDWIDETGTTTENVTTTYSGLSLSARVGDFPAITISTTTGVHFTTWLASNADTAGSLYINADATGDQAGWAVVAANLNLQIMLYVDPPAIACAGDSILRGSNSWDNHNTPSGYDVVTYQVTNDPAYQVAYQMRNSNPISYQNGSIGGIGWLTGMSVYAPEMIAVLPRLMLLSYGLNDVLTLGTTWNDASGYMDTILAAAKAATKPVNVAVAEILPCTAADDTEAATIREWNANYAAWCHTNGVKLVRCHDALGKVRVSTGELDDIADAYDCGDGMHFSTAGIAAHAAAMAPDLRSIK